MSLALIAAARAAARALVVTLCCFFLTIWLFEALPGDAARALATVRQVLVSRTTADIDLRAYVILRSDAAVPEEAVTAALAASQERERWFDDEGRGPLALPRTTFVLRCMAR